MAVGLRNSVETYNSTTVSKPTGTVSGDLWVVFVSDLDSSQKSLTGASFTRIADSVTRPSSAPRYHSAFYRYCDGSEPSSVTLGGTTSYPSTYSVSFSSPPASFVLLQEGPGGNTTHYFPQTHVPRDDSLEVFYLDNYNVEVTWYIGTKIGDGTYVATAWRACDAGLQSAGIATTADGPGSHGGGVSFRVVFSPSSETTSADLVLRNPASATAAATKAWRDGAAAYGYIQSGGYYRFAKPSGLAAGDLWMQVLSIQQSATLSLPAGYTKLVDNVQLNSTAYYTTIWYRICDGNEAAYVDATGYSADPLSARLNFAISGCSGLAYSTLTYLTQPSDGSSTIPVGDARVTKNDGLDLIVAFSSATSGTCSNWPWGTGAEALDNNSGYTVVWQAADAGMYPVGVATRSEIWSDHGVRRFVFVPTASQPSGAANVILAEEAAAEGGGTLPWSNIWRPSRV